MTALQNIGDRLTPGAIGVGLKPPHAAALAGGDDVVDWLEIHAENYLVAGGPRHRQLEILRADYALSVHAVGTSLMSAAPVDPTRLRALAGLVQRYEPALVSEHLAWSAWDGRCFNDLLPGPYTGAALDACGANVGRLQDALGRQVLIENPALYLRPAGDQMSEAEFLSALCRRSGCGLLLDINNVVVSTANLGGNPDAYLAALPPEQVGQIHLAGHQLETGPDYAIRIDDHGSAVGDMTWRLYADWIARHGARPTLVEWDTNVPDWPVLRAEAARAGATVQGLNDAA